MTHPTRTADKSETDRTDHEQPTLGLSRRDALRAGAVTGIGMAIGSGTAAGATDPTIGNCQPSESESSPRPGPDVLYQDPVTAPQFDNKGATWDADPLLVCGAQGYDDGEFLYQDWVYDDYGANTDENDTDPQPPTETFLAKPVGDIVYPTDDEKYRDNAADLLEFRCRQAGGQGQSSGGIHYRITLNTLVDDHPDAPIVAIGIDTESSPGDTTSDWGHGLGELGAPVTHVLVVTDGTAILEGPDGSVIDHSVDTDRNQIQVSVDLDPGEETWRHYCVTGIHDGEGGFAQVQDEADEDNPGGAKGQDPPPVFNVAFRDEPVGDPHHWRDKAQADALVDRNIGEFGADIDFGRLQDGVTTREQADPTKLTAYVNRVFSSRVSIDGQDSFGASEEGVEDDGDDAVLTGRVQPYSVYVPESYDPADPGPLHVLPHSLGQSYNQYAGNPNLLRQLGEQRDALILMFEGRGPAGWWHDEAEYDLFEAWADFRARYEYDEDRVTVGGYSMGGYATYRLASLYPDLFASGFEIVGPPDESIFGGPTDEHIESEHNTLDVTDNIRHIPLLMWHGSNDELVPLPGPVNYAQDLREHGYRHELDVFPGYDHFLFSIRDQWGPGKEFLQGAEVTRHPDRVTYRSKPVMGNEQFGLTYTGAYWLSGIEVAMPASDSGGLVDATSFATGYGDPEAENFSEGGMDPDPHIKRGTRWKEPVEEAKPQNRLALTLTGIESLTVWIEEAGLDGDRDLELAVSTDVSVTIRLATSNLTRSVTVPPGDHTLTVPPCSSRGTAGSGLPTG